MLRGWQRAKCCCRVLACRLTTINMREKLGPSDCSIAALSLDGARLATHYSWLVTRCKQSRYCEELGLDCVSSIACRAQSFRRGPITIAEDLAVSPTGVWVGADKGYCARTVHQHDRNFEFCE
jgi:hypothetical protein